MKEITGKRKLSWLVDFIRGDAPEYGVLTLYVFAPDEATAIEHIKSSYGENSKFISIK